VVLYTIEGGGHTWPGGTPLPEWLLGPMSRSVDATRLMWAFFRAHPVGSDEAIAGLRRPGCPLKRGHSQFLKL